MIEKLEVQYNNRDMSVELGPEAISACTIYLPFGDYPGTKTRSV